MGLTRGLVHDARVGVWRARKACGAATRALGRGLSSRYVYADPFGDRTRAVLVVGSGRSGTTKLAEALASSRTTRLIFEPLNPGRSPYAPRGFVAGAHRVDDAADPDLLAAWTRVLTGRVRSGWTDSDNRSRLATRRVVKCIAATNLTGWLRHHFPNVPIVYVHRHPLAVAASIVGLQDRGARDRARARRWTPDTMREWSAATGLLEGPLAHLAPEIARILARERTPYEDRVLRWCMENYDALNRPPDDRVLVVRFEEVVDDPDTALRAVARATGLDVRRGLREFDRPSSTDWTMGPTIGRTTGADDRDGLRRDRREGWRARVSAADRAAGAAIVDQFGLERLLEPR